MFEDIVKIMGRSYQAEVVADQEGEFGFRYTNSAGKAHVHCLISFKDTCEGVSTRLKGL